MNDHDSSTHRRRDVLRTIGIGTAIGVGGLSAITGAVSAWERQDVDFKGCSEVWIILDENDLDYSPPVVLNVVLARPGESPTCRTVEITGETTTRIPGQYGTAPIRKVRADDGQKILGVIFYNYQEEDRFSEPSKIIVNDHTCALTPGTPSIEAAPCYQHAISNGGYLSESSDTRGPGTGRGPPGRGFEDRDSGKDADSEKPRPGNTGPEKVRKRPDETRSREPSKHHGKPSEEGKKKGGPKKRGGPPWR